LRGGRRFGCPGAVTGGINYADDGLNRDGLAFATLISFSTPAEGEEFPRRLCRSKSQRALVALDFIAGLFQPFGDGAFKDAFAHLGHYDIDCHLRVSCGA